MRSPSSLLACLLLGGSALVSAAAGQSTGSRPEAPYPWALREEFDPNVIPGFAAWFQRSVDRVMEDALARGVSPGAYVVVGHGGEVVLSRAYGRVDWPEDAPPVTDETLWDLASVTKVAATTLAVMVLVDEGRLDPDAPLDRYLDGWPHDGPRSRITVRHLLNHTAGFPPGVPASVLAGGTDVVGTLARIPLEAEPGGRQVYSDLGPVLAAKVVASVAGEPFDRFVERRIYRPLGLEHTVFRPLDHGIPADGIAPTEVLAGRQLRGVVHDPVARALGGVAGDAGLFSSARDLAVLASALLWESPARVVCRDVIRSFTTRGSTAERYAVGWEMPDPGTVWGEVLSPVAFGHTGYTGTSLWMDPERDLFVILLTSRLNPTSSNQGHEELRAELHSVISRAHTGDEAAAAEADWRIPATWRGVDSCRGEAGRAILAGLGVGALAPLAWR